ncbi:MAG: pyruvate:ferredoxin (flavodoxin) oxidoreductase [Tepidisphaeraceae bacterium]
MAVTRKLACIDANEAVAHVAHRVSEVVVIYPITPSSPMGELSDEWAAHGVPNIWGQVPTVAEMQSEGGAIGAVHGALQAGSMCTTFTASQGLLLMIPNLYKIAGELTPFCIHVAARTLATHALSIFGDHSDVMACRQTGVAMLCSNTVQEAHDLAMISHAATLETRVPFMHFFDGFRTSHEVGKAELLTDEDMRAMLNQDAIAAHRGRALSPDSPKIRGTAQNPDAFFQAREACNKFYEAAPAITQGVMDRFAKLTGRQYKLYEYVGAPDADRVAVCMGSGCETIQETVEYLNAQGQKVGLVKVRLYRPLAEAEFLKAIPASVKSIAVLDRTKEPGAAGEPLYQETIVALARGGRSSIKVVGGRYGLSSKEFTAGMVVAVFDNLNAASPKNGFTVGINDDVTHLSLAYDADLDIEAKDVTRAMFFGLGADGTVGANKNSIKIIGEETPLCVQGYFVYDSKKSGAMTVSHLRFGPRPIRSIYLIRQADFLACHQFNFLEKIDVLEFARKGATVLLNVPCEPEHVWDRLPREVQEQVVSKGLKLYAINADRVAQETGMGRRINTIMQTCFFAISGVLPREEAIAKIKKAVEKTYGKKGNELVLRNWEAIDQTLANLKEVKPCCASSPIKRRAIVSDAAPDFVKRVTSLMMAGKGDLLPVSAFPVDGTWPTATTKWEKRTIALEVPTWQPDLCIQCGKCAFVCPHAAIRAKAFDPAAMNGSKPESFQTVGYKAPDLKGNNYTIQVAPEDCTGCTLCVSVCPAKDKSNASRKAINMTPLTTDVLDRERKNYDYFLKLPDVDRSKITRIDVKGSQLMLPLFEYSGACAGCGETPYVKLLTQLFGSRLLIANATGCSSIYGGNLPTTPYCVDLAGRGPAWANSLFEDNAEFGFGMRLATEMFADQARGLIRKLSPTLGIDTLQLTEACPTDEVSLAKRRLQIEKVAKALASDNSEDARRLRASIEHLLPRSVWLLGGDGWAYDIGYGGLDHVLASGKNVNVLVLDTEVYSNTGGQSSKSTPLGAAAKFAAAGKAIHKKDLGLMAMSYGHVYVASIALGASDAQTVKVFQEAESYDGPSLIIAYSHCIAHGYDLSIGLEQQKRAVNSGVWPLYRYDPRRIEQGQAPLQIDSKPPTIPVSDYVRNETRFRMVEKMDPERFKKLSAESQKLTTRRIANYEQLSKLVAPMAPTNGQEAPKE